MATRLKELRVDFGSLVDEPANKGARVCLFKRADEPTEKIGRKMSAGRMNRMKEIMGQLTALMAEVQGEEAGGDTMAEDTKKAAVEEPVEKTAPVEDVEKAALSAEVAELKKALTAETDKRVLSEFVQKAAVFKHLSIKTDTLGAILKRCHESLSADEYTALDTLLKAADEAAKPAFKEIGQTGSDSAATATDELNQLAQTMVTEKKAINYADAISQIGRENPVLVGKYRREQQSRN